MRIGFDAKRLFHNSTGLGNYSRTLLKNSLQYFPDNQYFLFEKSPNNSKVVSTLLESKNGSIISPKKRSIFWRTSGMKNLFQKLDLSLFHGLSNELPLNVNIKKTPTLVTVHDLIFKTFPSDYKKIDRNIYTLKSRHACKSSTEIIAISESTKSDICYYYGISPEKISVVYQPVDSIYYDDNEGEIVEGIPKEYILYVSSITPRKNLLPFLKAYDKLPQSFKIPVLVVGNGTSYKKKVYSYISEKKMGKNVHFLDSINSLEKLKYLYKKASVLVYPSSYEGFGLPIVEALLSKCPVLTCNNSSLPEAGGKSVTYINDPYNTEEFSIALENLLHDEAKKENNRENGFQFAHEQFSPEKLTKQLFERYEKKLNYVNMIPLIIFQKICRIQVHSKNIRTIAPRIFITNCYYNMP